MQPTDAAPPPTCRQRAVDLLRPVGSSRWGMAAWLAGGLGAILGVTAALGHAELGSAVGLGFVLTAVPSLPVAWRPALSTLAIRGLTVLVGAALAILTSPHLVALGLATVVAAGCGGLLARVGPTAGLAVVLVAVDLPDDEPPVLGAALLPYLAGVAVVAVAWTAWFACAEMIRRRRGAPPAPADRPAATWRESWPHAVRVGIAVAVAVGLAGLLPDDLVGGHWLVTSVLLTVQPAAGDTGVRLVQRLSGNTVGALIAAVVLGTHPAAPIVAVVTVALFTLAMALRPVNYTWWAITGPPVLLVISEYPGLFPWYEGGVRLAMNMAGAAIVLLVVFVFPLMTRVRSRRETGGFTPCDGSDSVYKIQSRRV